MTTGEKIKQIRQERGLTQEELGDMVNLSGVAIMRYEKGQREPKQSTLIKIAKALDVHLRDLADTSIWKEFDEKYPNLGNEIEEFENFIKFLESVGYIAQFIQEDEEGENYSVELSKNGTTIEFSKDGFEEFKLKIKDSVDYQVWHKFQEKK